MGQISLGLLVVVALTLTAYFGFTAWRNSSDERAEITGTVLQRHK